MVKQTEQEIVNSLRERISSQKPEVLSEKNGLSNDEALLEAEYMFKKMLSENQPTSPFEAQTLIDQTFSEIFDYFKKVGVSMEPNKLFTHLTGSKGGPNARK